MKKSLETNLIAETFSWARKNKTLHGRLHCSTEIVALRDRFALDALSEEGLESTNKNIRRYLEILARKSSPTEQSKEVMHRFLERSNPIRLFNRKMIKKTLISPECRSNKQLILVTIEL